MHACELQETAPAGRVCPVWIFVVWCRSFMLQQSSIGSYDTSLGIMCSGTSAILISLFCTVIHVYFHRCHSAVVYAVEKPFQWLFGLPGSFGAALLLGAAGGYPVGAKTIATLYQQGQCSRRDAEKALRFCNNAGPAFLISAVGASLLQDPHAGLKLYAVHVLSALIIGFIYRKNTDYVKYHCITADHMRSTATISLFLRAVTDAFSSFLNVSAFVLIFSVISTMLQQLPLIDSLHCLPGGGILWYGLLAGFLELTSGVACLTQGGLPSSILLPALSFLCGWGGCSVQFQTINLLHDAGLSCSQYLKSKLLQGILAALITGMICF